MLDGLRRVEGNNLSQTALGLKGLIDSCLTLVEQSGARGYKLRQNYKITQVKIQVIKPINKTHRQTPDSCPERNCQILPQDWNAVSLNAKVNHQQLFIFEGFKPNGLKIRIQRKELHILRPVKIRVVDFWDFIIFTLV